MLSNRICLLAALRSPVISQRTAIASLRKLAAVKTAQAQDSQPKVSGGKK